MEFNLHFLDDDYAINRFHELTLSTYTKENNCSIQFFDDSKALLSQYEDDSNKLPDLLFLDINMPVIDGWQFLDAFCESFPNAKTRIVILTTSNNPEYVKKSLGYSIVLKFEIKPLRVKSMKEILPLLTSDILEEE